MIINGRKQADVERVVTSLNEENFLGTAVALAGDLSTAEGEQLAFDFVESQNQPLDVLVNNVGIFEVKDFFENTDADWDRYFQINVMGAVRLSRRFLKGCWSDKAGEF